MARLSVFTNDELAYLHGERRLGRVATVGKDGTPHVVPGGWTHNTEHDTIDVTGRAPPDRAGTASADNSSSVERRPMG